MKDLEDELLWDYKAVSYPLEDEDNQQYIFSHDERDDPRSLKVRLNCYNTLRHREDYDDRLLWTDAICIDQENLRERADQGLAYGPHLPRGV